MSYYQVKEKADAIERAVRECGALLTPQGQVSGVGVPCGIPGMDTCAESLDTLARALGTSMFKILFMGTFKNGKSTTVNAMLGRSMLPVGAMATTAVISQVVYGENSDQVQVYRVGEREPETMSLDAFNQEFRLTYKDIQFIEETGSLDRFQDIDYVVLNSDAELFQDGVQLIDSPGLEEAVSRTRATEQFFPQANAIVFLLSATHPFSSKEKQFITRHFAHAEPKPRNVFFVMNRINQVSSAAEAENLRDMTWHLLEPVFTVNGVVDHALMEQRVFFVNSFGALEAIQRGRSAEGTGIPEFQAMLESFLTGEERVMARYQSVMANLAAVWEQTTTQVRQAEQLLQQPLSELEDRAKASQARLDELEGEIISIERVIDRVESLVTTKLLNDLQRFLTVDIQSIWTEHAAAYDQDFGIVDMVKLALPMSDAAKEELLRPMTAFLNEFLSDQLERWSDRAALLIEPDIQLMQQELADRSLAFDIHFQAAADLFRGVHGQAWDDTNRPNKLQLALSLIQGDISVAVENAGGGNFNWSEFVKRYVVQAVINIMIYSLVGGGLPGLIVAAVVELVQLGMHRQSARQRLLDGMAERLFPHIADSLLEKRDEITEDIHAQFSQQKENVTSTARKLILDEKSMQQQILATRQKQASAAEAEIRRQNELLGALRERVSNVGSILYGRDISDAYLHKLAAVVGIDSQAAEA